MWSEQFKALYFSFLAILCSLNVKNIKSRIVFISYVWIIVI